VNGGGLALREGVLFWGVDLGGGAVRAFDLDGRPLGPRLDLGPKSSVSGLVADGDRRLWIADTQRGELRGMNLFGYEGAEFVPLAGKLEAPVGGVSDGPVDVALAPGEAYVGLWVARGGRRRAAVGLFLPDGTRLQALRSLGDPKASFDRVTRLAGAGELLAVLEAGEGRVQVFRRTDFHFAFAPKGGHLAAGAGLADGRFVVGLGEEGGERLVLFDAAGRAVRELAPEVADAGGGDVTGIVDLAVEERGSDRRSRLFLLDREGTRVQVFNLEGRCYGAFGGFDDESSFTAL
jgi:hypothetical protein